MTDFEGHIAYQFRVFGGITVIYIMVEQLKQEVGTTDKHLDAVAKLIAEAEGMYLTNTSHGALS